MIFSKFKIEKHMERQGADSHNLKDSSQPLEDKVGLEEIVQLANKAGLEYVEAKREAERLELLKPSIRAKIMIKLDTTGKTSEVKLRRLTETSDEYIEFLENLSEKKAQSERLRIKYESYKNLFEARRSMLSYQKAEMKLL